MPAWSGFWDGLGGAAYALTTNSRTNVRRQLGLRMNGYGRLKYNRIIRQLVAGAVGGTASGTYTRITAPSSPGLTDLGGVRTIETVTMVNRATTAADQAQIDADLLYSNSPTFAVDRSGNGGGGKSGL